MGGLFCAYSRMVSSILGLSPLGGRSTPDSQLRHPGMSADSAECPLGGKNHPLWKAGEGQAMPTALVSACAEQQAQDPLVRNRQNNTHHHHAHHKSNTEFTNKIKSYYLSTTYYVPGTLHRLFLILPTRKCTFSNCMDKETLRF